ncbi:MAG: hypothetical protein CFE26_22745 [Verrucomicrobiales bacterium VVV1]|nr:MAG: hypothetical protein CFE26_22745 [Verrucomicrobiales bacterium VVV1]
MNETTARQLLKGAIRPDGSLVQLSYHYLIWPSNVEGDLITVDGYLTAEELEALAWWMKNTKVPPVPEPPKMDQTWACDKEETSDHPTGDMLIDFPALRKAEAEAKEQ